MALDGMETDDERVERLTRELFGDAPDVPTVNESIAPRVERDDGMMASFKRDIETIKQRPASSLVRPALEGLGTVAGVTLTAPLSPVGQAAGGALGFAGGSALADFAETMMGERAPLMTAPEVLGRTKEHLEQGGLMESGGRIISHAIQGAKTGTKSLLRLIIAGQAKPITPEQKIIADTAQEMGIHLRPSEITSSDTAAQVEQNARRSWYGRGKFQRLDEENSRNLINFYETYAEKVFGKQESPLELGRLVQDAVKGHVIPDVQAVNKGLYQTLHHQTGGARIVDTSTPLKAAEQLKNVFSQEMFPKSHAIAAKLYELLSEPGATTGLRVKRGDVQLESGESQLSGAVRGQGGRYPQLHIKQVSEAPRKPSMLTYMQAHDARSLLLDLSRTGEMLSSREKSVATNLAGSLDDAMEMAAKSFDKQHKTNIYEDWRIANASMKASHELFDSAVIRKAVSVNPEDVVKVAFNRDAQTETNRVLEALSRSQNGLNIYRQSAFKELLARSQKDGRLNPQMMYEKAYGANGVGDTVMTHTFKELAPEIKRFLATARNMNMITVYSNTNPGQTGSNLINWFEQGMILSIPISLATKGVEAGAMAAGGAGLYAISMDQIARLVNSRNGIKLLMEASKLSPATKEGARVGGLLLKELAKTNE